MQESPQPRGAIVPRNKYLLVIALITFVVAFPEAVGVISIPFGQWLSALSGSLISSTTLGDFMRNYGYISLFGLMFLESASLPVPSEVVLPFAGYLVSTGVLNFWLAVLLSTAAGIAGALLDYYIAKWLGRPVVVELLKIFRLHQVALERAERWFQRSGEWTVFIARFIPGLRTIISLPAGLFEMKLSTFVSLTLAGCFAWSVILVYAGVLAGNAGNAYSQAFNSPAAVQGIAAIFAAAAAAYVIYYFFPSVRKTRPTPSSES